LPFPLSPQAIDVLADIITAGVETIRRRLSACTAPVPRLRNREIDTGQRQDGRRRAAPRPLPCHAVAAPGPMPVARSAARPSMPARWRAAPGIKPGEALYREALDAADGHHRRVSRLKAVAMQPPRWPARSATGFMSGKTNSQSQCEEHMPTRARSRSSGLMSLRISPAVTARLRARQPLASKGRMNKRKGPSPWRSQKRAPPTCLFS
jgi:hypothetical protein